MLICILIWILKRGIAALNLTKLDLDLKNLHHHVHDVIDEVIASRRTDGQSDPYASLSSKG